MRIALGIALLLCVASAHADTPEPALSADLSDADDLSTSSTDNDFATPADMTVVMGHDAAMEIEGEDASPSTRPKKSSGCDFGGETPTGSLATLAGLLTLYARRRWS